MVHKRTSKKRSSGKPKEPSKAHAAQPSALFDTRIIYCGDCLGQLIRLPDRCIDQTYVY